MKKTYFEPSMKIGHVALTNIIATSVSLHSDDYDLGEEALGRRSNPIWD